MLIKKIKKICKGFTLIELLAVIVILAIIALIATPITLSVIENSKRSSVKVGTLHYVDTIEKELQYDELKDENIESGKYVINEDGTYSVKGKTKKINAKGHLPTSGIMCINEKGLVESYSVVLDGYVVTDSIGKQEIEKGTNLKSLTCDVKEELVEIEIPENSSICSKNKTVKIKYPEYAGMIKEYSLNRKEWIEYKSSLTIKENGTIYARLRSKKTNETSNLATLTITTIDNDKVLNEKPSLILSQEKPTSEIQATFKQTDNCGLDNSTIEYGISETKEGSYEYQKENVFKNLKNNTTYYIKTRANDIAGNGIEESEISEIKTGEFSGIEITPNSTSWTTSKTVTIKGSTTGAKLQYKVVSGTTVKTDWTEYSSALTINWTATTSNPTYVYARLYDGTNYSSEASLTITTVDTTSPTVPNVIYNSGSNTCSWKNNYNFSLSSSDNESGISYYEIDWDNDGIANTTTGSNFIPWNNYNFCSTRFRAVDKVGNRSEWTGSHHIHMDTEAPSTPSVVTLENVASGAWANSATLSAAATDNVGVSYYQYSHDTVGMTTFPNPWTLNSNGQWPFYIRAVDYAGNVSGWSSPYTLRIARSVDVTYETEYATGSTLTASNGTLSGIGNATAMYYIKINATSSSGIDGNVEYNVHSQTDGWLGWKSANTKVGNGKRIESIKIRLTGNMANLFDVYYMVHVQSNGDLGWARNGEEAGSHDLCKRLEKIAIRIIPKDENPSNYGINYGSVAPAVTDSSKTNCSTTTTCTKTCTRSVPYTGTCYKYKYACTSSKCSEGASVNYTYCSSSGCNCCRTTTSYSCTKYKTETYTCC